MILGIAEKYGAGDEARTRNFQLGKLNERSFIFNTYKTFRKKCTCMHCIPCMRCLICVSLGDVWGTMCHLVLPPSSGISGVNEGLKAIPTPNLYLHCGIAGAE